MKAYGTEADAMAHAQEANFLIALGIITSGGSVTRREMREGEDAANRPGVLAMCSRRKLKLLEQAKVDACGACGGFGLVAPKLPALHPERDACPECGGSGDGDDVAVLYAAGRDEALTPWFGSLAALARHLGRNRT